MSIPQVIVSLTPDGGLKVELPGIMGTRRSIELAPGREGETLTRILLAQLENKAEIGEDGAPTTQQLKHWEQHDLFPRDNCRFCIAEGRIKPQVRRAKRQLIDRRPDGVEIRKLAEKAKGRAKGPVVSAKTAEELGL